MTELKDWLNSINFTKEDITQDDERYSNLLRDVDEYSEQIDPFHLL